MAPEGSPVIVALGDSITDGTNSTPDTNSRWPDFLARRLVDRGGATLPAVLNVGIGGNRVLSDNAGFALFNRNADAPPPPPPNPNAQFGPSAQSRFDREVLQQADLVAAPGRIGQWPRRQDYVELVVEQVWRMFAHVLFEANVGKAAAELSEE